MDIKTLLNNLQSEFNKNKCDASLGVTDTGIDEIVIDMATKSKSEQKRAAKLCRKYLDENNISKEYYLQPLVGCIFIFKVSEKFWINR